MEKIFAALCFWALMRLTLMPVSAAVSGVENVVESADFIVSIPAAFLHFAIVMGVIFVVLLFTRRIAGWVDRLREKRNKEYEKYKE